MKANENNNSSNGKQGAAVDITVTEAMTKSEFLSQVDAWITQSQGYANAISVSKQWEPVQENGMNVMTYAAWCEHNFQSNLYENTGKERKWTFFSDISIGEWCSGVRGVADTLHRAFKEWLSNSSAIAELLISLAYKSYEMQARGKVHWMHFYSGLYQQLYRLVLDYYDQHDLEAAAYVIDYLD